jgi:hypothetical protein
MPTLRRRFLFNIDHNGGPQGDIALARNVLDEGQEMS